MTDICVNCRKQSNRLGFWFVNHYYGISGTFCSDCYTLISHDAYGKPLFPNEYLMILLKQESKHGKSKETSD